MNGDGAAAEQTLAIAETSLLDLGAGFLALPRGLCASPFFESLRADERFVVVTVLLRARWRAGEVFVGGQRCRLEVGQLLDAEQTIADAAGSTRKVVRTVYRKLAAAGFLTRAPVGPRKGQQTGQRPHVTTVLDYKLILYAGGEPGQQPGPQTGHPRVQQGAPVEQGEPGLNPGNPSPSPSVRSRRGKAGPPRSAAAPASPAAAFTGDAGGWK
jgi:hypothetical protein